MKYANNLVTETCDTNENSFIFELLLSRFQLTLDTYQRASYGAPLITHHYLFKLYFQINIMGLNSGKLGNFLLLS